MLPSFIFSARTKQHLAYLCMLFLCYPTVSANQAHNLPAKENKKLLIQAEEQPEIAISLDDAPMPGSILFTGMEKTQAIIQQLKAVDSPPIGIFALAMHAQTPQHLERLRMYGEAGHVIANHTYHHYKLNNTSSPIFIEDIQKAHDLLCTLPNFRPLFRFPYLCEGKDNTQRQEVIQALKKMGYQEGYVTVSNHDYHINKLVLQAVKAGKKLDYEKLKKVYLDILWSCIQTYDTLAKQVVKRKIKHVLLLHENDLAALFIGDLIQHIRAQGWKVIPIEEAYQDPIAAIDIINNYHYSGRITAIAVEKGLGKGLIGFPASTHLNYIAKALKQEGVFIDP